MDPRLGRHTPGVVEYEIHIEFYKSAYICIVVELLKQ